jgi:HlyD family secretion protein
MDSPIEKKKGLRPKTLLLMLSGVCLLALTLWLITTSGTSTFRIQAERITVATAIRDEFKDYISLVGTVAPISTILLDVEEGGKVIAKIAEEGQMLMKGDIIVRLENTDLNFQILNSESQLAYQSNELRNTMIQMERQKISNKQQLLSIDNELKLLKRNYERNTDLIRFHHISQEDYLISKDNFELALAERALRYEQMIQDSIFRENQHQQMNINLRNMEQNLRVVRQRLDKLNIQAPADGQLGSLNIETGQLINRGERIGQLHVLDDYKISASIDEHYIDRVRHNLKATFDRQNIRYELTVSRVYPEVRNGKFQIDFRFTGEKPENLRTGQTYHLSLELGQSLESTIIPRGGFFQSTGGQWVFVLSGNTALKRHIRIGRQNPLFYEVLEGLEPGEKIIINNYDLFGKSDRIVISNE